MISTFTREVLGGLRSGGSSLLLGVFGRHREVYGMTDKRDLALIILGARPVVARSEAEDFAYLRHHWGSSVRDCPAESG